MKIKLFITDIDGVWTDGGMYYTESGDELKKFNTADSAGIILLKLLGIQVAIISGENTKMVQNRASKLNIKAVHLGVKDKVGVAKKLINTLNISWEQVAYIGDDLNDILLLRKVGLSACPSSSEDYIKKEVDWVLTRKGGEGVFREFVQQYLQSENQLTHAINLYLGEKEKEL